MDYVRGLSRETRSNAWELARKAGHEGPHLIQSLLSRRKWRWEPVRAALPQLAQQVLPDDPHDEIGPGLALDETAHLRKGKSAACVSPQHAGVTGRVENCVTWVFTVLVTACGQAWVDFDVYMPDYWARDPRRREKAGRSGDFRAGLRALGLSYVAIAPCATMITCGNGAKGPRYVGLGAARHAGPGRTPAEPPPPGPGKEPVHVLPVPRRRRPPRDLDLLPHHRVPQVAGRDYFQDGKGRLRLGPDPGAHLGRPLPAHRPDRLGPAQGHRHPVVPVRRRRPPADPGDRPGQPPRPAAACSNRC
jgi:hypothetical protein